MLSFFLISSFLLHTSINAALNSFSYAWTKVDSYAIKQLSQSAYIGSGYFQLILVHLSLFGPLSIATPIQRMGKHFPSLRLPALQL